MFSFIIGLLIGSSIWLLSSTLIEYFIERDRRKQMDYLFPSDEEMDDMAEYYKQGAFAPFFMRTKNSQEQGIISKACLFSLVYEP